MLTAVGIELIEDLRHRPRARGAPEVQVAGAATARRAMSYLPALVTAVSVPPVGNSLGSELAQEGEACTGI